MKVIFNYNLKHSIKDPLAIALGAFDGLHIGHQMLMRELNLIRVLSGCSTLVYTFLNNPMEFLMPAKAPSRLTTTSERITAFSTFNPDYLIFNTFDSRLASMLPRDFVENLLFRKYNVKYIVVGYDFKFGYGGAGDISLLKELSEEYSIKLITIPPLAIGEHTISSSLIRDLIKNGNMRDVSRYLGEHYSVSGTVVHGFGRGNKMGYPTANLEFDSRKAVPKKGIYLTRIKVDNNYHWALTNIGVNPTFNKKGLFFETHVLDFNRKIYGKGIKIEFLEFIRDEIKFDSITRLKEQIAKDIIQAKNSIYKLKPV
ncbi:MAG: bifunctional riboflavin kinase/FAD synthetase [Clostridiales bacterium]|nr:bifunctional riboflavin kinase/FAD synthetase [Clostridiales bacterium]